MGIDVRIESEHGREKAVVLDPCNLVQRFLPHFQDTSYACLRFVDPYGDTTFNQLQMPQVVRELEKTLGSIDDDAVRRHCESVLALARQANGQVHTYLKFYGD